jgi:hypothetical protein
MRSVFLIALAGIPLMAGASETVLTCTSIDEGEDVESATIRFDEDAGTFELRGKSMWSVKTDDEGAAKVKNVEFSADTITVKFKRRSALWLSLGAAVASSGRVGVLDRVTGTWTLGSHTYQCAEFNADDRQF